MPKFNAMAGLAFAAAAALTTAATLSVSAETSISVPAAAEKAPESSATEESIVLAGGCFWGMQVVFQHLDGVNRVVSGYSGGRTPHPTYEQVSTGTTGYAESVEVTFNPHKIGLAELLRVYFSVAHDPTQLNRQGPDEGTQYRSEVFASDPAQAKFVKDYIAQINEAKVFARPIATQVAPLANFYPAERYHQNYATLHPNEPYILYNERPKVENLKREFANLYKDKPVLLAGS